MKGTLEKLRKIFISKRRQEDDISASKFSRSLSFKKGSMRRSLRRLTRRKAVVTNHGIIYVEGDPNSPTTPTPPSFAAAFAFGQRVTSTAVDKPATDGLSPSGERSGAETTGAVRERSVTVSGVTGGACSSVTSPSDARASAGDGLRGSPAAERRPGGSKLSDGSSALLTAGGLKVASTGLASSTGNIPSGVTRPKVRRPTDSLPRIPTETDGGAVAALTAAAAGSEDCSGGRRASHCGAYRAVEAPHTAELLGRTTKIMSACLTPERASSDAGSARSDNEDNTRPTDGPAATGEKTDERKTTEEDKTKTVTTEDDNSNHPKDGSAQPAASDAAVGGGARRRLPTVTATRDHLRRSLRRLSERRRKSRRPESMASAPSAGLDFYKMFSRVPPVLTTAAAPPSTPFTFSRRNPITQWLAESERAQLAARKAPGAADWDALLWSEMVLTPPASEKEARRRAKRAAKKAGRARRIGGRTSSEASVASVGTAASGTEVELVGVRKVETELTPQALKA